MSLRPLTPGVIQALRSDFQRGTWSAVTQQFFQQIGDGSVQVEATTKALSAQIAALEADLATEQAARAALQAELDIVEGAVDVLEDEIAALQATVTGVEDFGVQPAGQLPGEPPRLADLGPRLETIPADFTLGGALWP